jgi:hypothetical protein
MKKLFLYIVLPALVLITYIAWPSNEIIHPSGVLVESEPYQKKIKVDTTWKVGEYSIRSLADFKIEARVLSKEGYSLDRESDLSPYDLALGWGPMSDQAVIDQMDIWQRNRWYYWETRKYPIPRREIQKNSANMHIIPANDEIEDKLDKIVKGNIIEIEGYLVVVDAEDQWHWKSSLSREDTGGGACEVVWAEKIDILK